MKTITIGPELFEKVEKYWGNEFLMFWCRGRRVSNDSFKFTKYDAHQIYRMIGKVLEKVNTEG